MRNLKLDEFTNYKFLSGVEFSPDGKNVCFAVSKCNVDDNKYDSNLWILNMESNKHFQLTGLDKERSFIWQNDSEHILFSSIRSEKDKKRQEEGEEFAPYYRISVSGGEATKYFEVPLSVTSIKEINDENYILTAVYNSMNKDLNKLNDKEKAEEIKRRKEEKNFEVLDEIPFWGNGSGFTNKKRNRLYSFNRASGDYNAISPEEISVESYNLNKQKNKIVYTGESFNNGVLSLKNAIYIYDNVTHKTEEILSSNQYNSGYVNFINDEKIIFVGTQGKEFGLNENRKIYILDVNTKEVTCITPELDKGLYNSVGSDCRFGASSSYRLDNELFYYTSTENECSFINKLDITTGNSERITEPNGSIDGLAINGEQILFIGLRGQDLQELYALECKKERKITGFNKWLHEEIKISKPEAVSFVNKDGITIDGWVVKPVDYDENKKYPAILNIHGGPKTVYGTVFYHEMQYWANEGYFVFFCNPRGSDGKGNEFADIRGKYGTIDYDDIMHFTDEVLGKFTNIDESRVGVTGGSYGGFMTNWIIGHTHRFKAAATQRSISNWTAKFGITDIGYFFVEDQISATPWNDHDKLWWHSPMRYADKVKTPTLVIHSDEDYRCWVNEGYQMFTSLRYHGVESRMCVFKGENHELSRSGKPKSRIRRLEELTNWFNKYLK